MRKIIVVEFITLDGVMQAPGGSKEDTAEGFKYGGWSAPFDDEVGGEEMVKQMKPTDLLLGRVTHDIFASYWPQHAEHWPGINEVTKYVMSKTINKSDWKNTVFISSIDEIKRLKNTEGGDIKVWGSGNLVQTLLKYNLVDELWLKIYPIVIGEGKKLFDKGTIPTAFNLFEHYVTPKGVIFASYKRAGEVKTGEIED
jgi:dihydrofolate reductase